MCIETTSKTYPEPKEEEENPIGWELIGDVRPVKKQKKEHKNG